MSTTEPQAPEREDAGVTCYRHPETPTGLRCSRCDRPICGLCATPASVGQHCPECVGEARRTTPRVRSAFQARSPAVYTILVINVIVFLIQMMSRGRITLAFGLQPIQIADGEWYRLITPMFLHAGLLHIGMNSIILVAFSAQVEEAFGTARFLGIYFITGFVASAASYAFGACNILGVGASGAIFGTIGVLLVFLFHRRRTQFVRAYMNQLIGLIVFNLVLGLLISGIDNWAHGGGLVSGVALGLMIDREGDPPPAIVQILSFAVVLGAGLALTMWRTANFGC